MGPTKMSSIVTDAQRLAITTRPSVPPSLTPSRGPTTADLELLDEEDEEEDDDFDEDDFDDDDDLSDF